MIQPCANEKEHEMTDNNAQVQNQPPVPNPDLKSLERIIGTWELSGDTRGTVTYAWLDGGFFLIQRFNFELYNHQVTGIEIIGHLQPFGEPASEAIKSRAYDSVGNTLDYEYELKEDTLMIWGGEKGSPAYFKGILSADDQKCEGGWVYPDGGGYTSNMTRVK